MVQMAHHLPESNPHAQHSQNSFLAVRRPVSFPSVSRREFGQMNPEELMKYNRELAKVRESETREWVTRQKVFGLNGMRPDNKREMSFQSEEVRKHLEKDAYFRANQEYLRLMNEEPNRQTFREKQRLTEDLEKQKRLLIEDLARDQQLKQDKYKRNHTSPFQPSDIRTLHYMNEKPRDLPIPLRMKPDLHIHPFARVDPRYPQPLGSAEEFHNFRRMQENMLKFGKAPVDIRQCSHSDFTQFSNELGPIIQEKEKKIKEMEEKLVRLEAEEKIHYLKKIEEQQKHLVRKAENSSIHLPHQSQQQPIYQSLTSSSPPQPISRSPFQPNLSPTTSKQQPQSVENSVSSMYNNDDSPPVTISTTTASSIDQTNGQRDLVTDKNNNTTPASTESHKIHDDVEKEITQSPKNSIHSPDHSNSSNEDLVIDDKLEKQQTPLKVPSSSALSNKHPNCIKIANVRPRDDETVTTEVIGDDKEFNEMKYGIKVQISPIKMEEAIYQSKDEDDVSQEDIDSKINGESSEQDPNDPNTTHRALKKRKSQKSVGKREEGSSPSDFQASQNRLALDLPGHNWLEKRLMQQNALSTNEQTEKIKDEKKEDCNESQGKMKNTNESSPPKDYETTEKTDLTKEESETNDIPSSMSTTQNSTPVLNTVALNSKPKELPRSELLLQMLDSSKPSTTYSQPSQVSQSNTDFSGKSPILSVGTGASAEPEDTIVSKSNIDSKPSLVVMSDLSNQQYSQVSRERYEGAVQEKRPIDRNSSRYDSNVETVCSPKICNYQEIRPNLVVERRKDSDGSSFPYILPKSHSNPNENVPYSKYIVEERYNRKRPMEEVSREEQEAALKRTEFSERFFSDLERGMLSKGKPEMTVLGSDPKELRLHASEQAKLHRRSLEEQSAKERLAKLESSDSMFLSRFKESQSQPPLPYKQSDIVLKSPTTSRSVAPSPKVDYPIPRYTKRPHSPPVAYRSHEEKMLQRRLPSVDGIPSPSVNGRLDPTHLLPHHHHPESLDPALMSNLRQSRDLKLLEEARRREKFQRSSLDSRKEALIPQSMASGKVQSYKTLSPPEEHLLNLNEKVRTVEDLRALQMGMPLSNGFQRYSRSNQILRNERLTEREKIALREADLIHQAAMKQEALASRQEIHIAYLEQARRRPNGELTSPISPTPSVAHGYSEEQMRIASLRRHEDEDKMRALMEERKLNESYSIPKEAEVSHFDASIPRFFSHKIPRTRDGSLDFGRSKPVDYSFLDYSNPGFREREATLGNPLKRPHSAHTSSEIISKLQRRSSPQGAYLMNKQRMQQENPGKHPGKSASVNPYEEKWRVLGEKEKRFCNICNKDAQYLCSGCRNVWYCSQDCQLNAWKTHSKTCSLGSER